MKHHFRKTALIVVLSVMALSGVVEVLGQDSTDNPTSPYPNWELVIDGAVSHTLSLSINDLAAMPKTEVYGAIYCDHVLVTQGTWGGVQVSALLNQAGLLTGASNLEFQAYDGYIIKAAVSYQQILMIAYELDGQPLNETLRLVVPGYPGNYWISQITEIKVTSSTNYDIGPWSPTPPPPTPKPTMPPPPTKAPTPTPTQQPSPTPEPTETPVTTPTHTPISSISSEPDTSQLASQQNNQELASALYSASRYCLPMLAVAITVATSVAFLLLRRRANTRAKKEAILSSYLEQQA
jgi:hypothetical protein